MVVVGIMSIFTLMTVPNEFAVKSKTLGMADSKTFHEGLVQKLNAER